LLPATPLAVVTSITYNYLPFMTLPLYVSLRDRQTAAGGRAHPTRIVPGRSRDAAVAAGHRRRAVDVHPGHR
jgi:hypothetical protein